MMKKQSLAPTMKDVAREAGVALGTVSKVVNGIPVGEEYKIRVEKAIKMLDYRVNSYAQGMKAGRTFTAALLIPNTREPFFAALTYQINLAFLRRKYRMLLCCTEFDPSLEQEYVQMVQQNNVDGIIGLTYHTGLVIEEERLLCRLTVPWDRNFYAWPLIILQEGNWQQKSWLTLAAKGLPFCVQALPWSTNRTNGRRDF